MFECSICLETIENDRGYTFSCGHVLCAPHVISFIIHHQFTNFTSSQRKCLQCPTCREIPCLSFDSDHLPIQQCTRNELRELKEFFNRCLFTSLQTIQNPFWFNKIYKTLQMTKIRELRRFRMFNCLVKKEDGSFVQPVLDHPLVTHIFGEG